MKALLIPLCLLLSFTTIAQERAPRHAFTLTTGFDQIKEGLNQGIVFKGTGLAVCYEREGYVRDNLLDYQAAFGFNTYFWTDMIGFSAELKPFRLYFGSPVFQGHKAKYYFGPTYLFDYNYQLYPYLHSGKGFWFSNYSLSPEMRAIIPLNHNKQLRLQISTSLINLTSRPGQVIEPYSYSFKFKDIIQDLHNEMTLSTLERVTQTFFSAELLFPRTKRDIALGYNFEYFGYHKKPILTNLNQQVHVKFYFKNKQ